MKVFIANSGEMRARFCLFVEFNALLTTHAKGDTDFRFYIFII